MEREIATVREVVGLALRRRSLWVLGLFGAELTSFSVRIDEGAVRGVELGWAIAAALTLLPALLAVHGACRVLLIDRARQVRSTRNLPAASLPGLWRKVLRSFGLRAALALAAAVVIAIAGAPLALGIAERLPLALGAGLTTVLALAAVPMLVTLHFTGIYGERFVVYEDRTARGALSASRRFLRGRILHTLRLQIGAIGAHMLTGLFAAPVVLGVLALAAFAYFVLGWQAAIVIGALLMLPLALALTGLNGTIQSLIFSLAFLDERPSVEQEAS
jgi:hypothetical protein